MEDARQSIFWHAYDKKVHGKECMPCIWLLSDLCRTHKSKTQSKAFAVHF
jgi:hypothetical protein